MPDEPTELTAEQKIAVINCIIGGLSVKPIMETLDSIDDGDDGWKAVGKFLTEIQARLERFRSTFTWPPVSKLTGPRLCLIESGSIELENGAGDGAYDLFDITGTPDEIGKAIGESLKTSDLFGGRNMPSQIDAGDNLFMNLRIKFCDPAGGL